MVAVRIRPSIILLGDSLTQFAFGRNGQVGWCQLLAQSYQRRADVFNRGFQGYNSQMILDHVLPELLVDTESNESLVLGGDNDATTTATTTSISSTVAVADVPVLFWTILLGANDAALSPGREAIPLDDFEKNLDKIVLSIRKHHRNNKIASEQSCSHTAENDASSTCTADNSMDEKGMEFQQEQGEVPIILMTPPPCDVDLWRKVDTDDKDIPDNGNAIYKLYADRVKDVAHRHSNCSLVDVWTLLGGNDIDSFSEKEYQTDGVHLSSKGNRVVYQGLMEVIQRDYPNLMPMTDGNGQFGKQGIPMEGKLWWMY